MRASNKPTKRDILLEWFQAQDGPVRRMDVTKAFRRHQVYRGHKWSSNGLTRLLSSLEREGAIQSQEVRRYNTGTPATWYELAKDSADARGAA